MNEEELEQIKEEVIELLKNKRYSNLNKYLEQINNQDIPALFEELSQEDMVRLFRVLPKDEAADVFSYMEPDLQEKLINSLTDKELKSEIEELIK